MLRVPESLEINRARALCPQTIERFYQNLEDPYVEYNYESIEIWNYDESGAQASKIEREQF